MDENLPLRQSGTITIGEDLYGLSVNELEARITDLETEIIRVKGELSKKSAELKAAENLFGTKN